MTVWNWPVAEINPLRPKRRLAGKALAAKVNSRAGSRRRTTGHEQAVTTGRSPAVEWRRRDPRSTRHRAHRQPPRAAGAGTGKSADAASSLIKASQIPFERPSARGRRTGCVWAFQGRGKSGLVARADP